MSREKGAGNDRFDVGESVYHLDMRVVVGNVWGEGGVLGQGVGHFQVDGQVELSAGIVYEPDQCLQTLLRVGHRVTSVVDKQHLIDEHHMELGSGKYTGNAVELVVYSSAEVDALCAVLEGVLELYGEENFKDRRREDLALLYAVAHSEGVRCSNVVAGCAVHILAEVPDHLEQSWG